MNKYIKLEDAKVAIREKFKSIEDRVEINSVLNGLPTLNITEYVDKHQAYSEGYAKGVVYGGLLKSEVSEEQLSKLKSRENSVENTTVSEDFTSISRAKKEGEWVESEIPNELYVCSECGGACWSYDYERNIVKSNYCPNCGAKMKGAEE